MHILNGFLKTIRNTFKQYFTQVCVFSNGMRSIVIVRKERRSPTHVHRNSRNFNDFQAIQLKLKYIHKYFILNPIRFIYNYK